MVGQRPRDVLQEHRFTGTRRRHDQRALTLAYWRHDIDHARGLVLDGRVERVEPQLLVRIERREVIEIDAMADSFRIVVIDQRHAGQGKIALALLGTADLAFDRVTRPETEAPDDRWSDIDVVRSGEVIGFGRTEETKTIV